MLKKIVVTISLTGMSFACSSSEQTASSPKTLEDATNIAARSDGKYDVTCKDGSREIATMEQIQRNEVCGGGASSGAAAIISMRRRPDGQFDVICRNGSQEVATADRIRDGEVCDRRPTFPVYEDERARLRWHWPFAAVDYYDFASYCGRLGPGWAVPDSLQIRQLAAVIDDVLSTYNGQIGGDAWFTRPARFQEGDTDICVYDFTARSEHNCATRRQHENYYYQTNILNIESLSPCVQSVR